MENENNHLLTFDKNKKNFVFIALMKKIFRFFILFFFLFPFSFFASSASPLPHIFKLIREGNYAMAKEKLFSLYERAGDDVAINFGLAFIYFQHDNANRNLDSAQIFASRTEIILADSFPAKKMKHYAQLGVRLYYIHQLSNQIYAEGFHRADSLNSVAAWNFYLNHYGLSPMYKEAVAKRNKRAFENAKSTFDYSSFEDFMKQYPDANEIAEAKDLYELLLFKSKTKDSTWQVYDQFMNDFPNSPYFSEAKNNYEILFYKYSTRHHTLNEFVLFENTYAESPWRKDAQDSIYFLATRNKTIEEYDFFVKNFSTNSHINEVWMKLYRASTLNYSVAVIDSFEKKYSAFPFQDFAELEKQIASSPIVPYESEENDWYGLKDTVTKNITMLPKYFFIDTFSNNLALFNPDSCEEHCAYGFLNKNGDVAIAPKFSDAYSFCGKAAPVAVNNLNPNDDEPFWGFINRWGEWIIEPTYELALPFKEKMSLVLNYHVGYGFVNEDGQLQISTHYVNAHSFYDSVAAVQEDTLWGFINSKDKFIIPSRYKDVADFHEKLCAAQDTSMLWGFIDKKGNWKIKPQYLKAGNFENGKAQVMLKPKNATDLPKLKFINTEGKLVK